MIDLNRLNKVFGGNSDFNLNIWGDKPSRKKKITPKKKTKTRKTNITKTKRGTIYSYWKDEILDKQKDLCSGKTCAKDHNGKRVKINSRSHFDHIKPLALGGKHLLKNIQGLCSNCHMKKTRKDRFDIAQAKKKGLILRTITAPKTKKMKSSEKVNAVINLLTNEKKMIPKSEAEQVEGLYGKYWIKKSINKLY